MPHRLINAALSILAAVALASCGEKPPRPDPEAHRVYDNAMPQHPAYERTLKQGESERIAH
jgi:predicted small lipoprotein YifL